MGEWDVGMRGGMTWGIAGGRDAGGMSWRGGVFGGGDCLQGGLLTLP